MPISTQTLKSGGRSIRIQISEPLSTSTREGRLPAVLLLHGAGGNVSFWLDHIAPTIANLGIAVYAIHYFDSTGIQRATPAVLADGVSIPIWLQTVRDALSFIAARPNVDAQRIALVGISLGAFLSLALGTEASSPARSADLPIRAIVEISGGLMPPWDARATKAYPPTLLLHGENDTVVPVSNAHALDALLTRLAVPHTLQTLPNEGHWFSVHVQLRILASIGGFLKEHL